MPQFNLCTVKFLGLTQTLPQTVPGADRGIGSERSGKQSPPDQAAPNGRKTALCARISVCICNLVLLPQTGQRIHFVCIHFPLLLNHNFLDGNLLNFFGIYIHQNFINRDKANKRNKHNRKVKFICRYTFNILKNNIYHKPQ